MQIKAYSNLVLARDSKKLHRFTAQSDDVAAPKSYCRKCGMFRAEAEKLNTFICYRGG